MRSLLCFLSYVSEPSLKWDSGQETYLFYLLFDWLVYIGQFNLASANIGKLILLLSSTKDMQQIDLSIHGSQIVQVFWWSI
jgi:hypothetical protein